MRPLLVATVAGAVSLAGVAFVTPAEAATHTYYVAPSGSDGAAGTLRAPWKTVTKGLRALRAGDTLYLRGGTYPERVGGSGFLSVAPGTADSRVTVTAYPGERPVIKGLLRLTGMDYWTLDGVNVTWSSANSGSEHMVRLKNGKGWVYQDSEIWGAESYANLNVLGDKTGQPANWTVRRNCVHHNYGDPSHSTAQDQLMYINTGTSSGAGTIERNLIFNAPRGKAVKLAGPEPGTGPANVTVRYNTVYDTMKPGVVVGWAAKNSKVYRNLLGSTEDRALIRGYELTGTGNQAWDNYGFGASAILASDPGYQRIADLGGNRLGTAPQFDGYGCSGFHPAASSAAADYGRYAP